MPHALSGDKRSGDGPCRFSQWICISCSGDSIVDLRAMNAGPCFKLIGVTVLLSPPRVENHKTKMRKEHLFGGLCLGGE